MKWLFTYLTFFSLSQSYANNFYFDLNKDSLKRIDEKYDSLKYSFLPKYEIYGRYFNPFAINSTSRFAFDFGFKWHTKKLRYLKTNIIATGNNPVWNLQILSISQMWRLTLPKINWIHAELSYGVAISHYGLTHGWYIENWFGFGPIINAELQFDFGNRSNICLGSYLTYQQSYALIEQTDFTVPFPVPSNYFSAMLYTSFQPLIYVGFNLYLK